VGAGACDTQAGVAIGIQTDPMVRDTALPVAACRTLPGPIALMITNPGGSSGRSQRSPRQSPL
jgi:hypothetical protein